jgi:hypothetical protein
MQVTIRKYQSGNFFYYEASFLNGNLLAYSMFDLISQMGSIYGVQLKMFSSFFNCINN